MSEEERILENINASMAMEDMPLTQENKRTILACLEGKKTFQSAVDEVISRYSKKQAV